LTSPASKSRSPENEAETERIQAGCVSAAVTIEIPGKEPILYELGNTTSIGRTSLNQICLKDDIAISRQHALIRRQGEHEYHLIDMGSANGTFLNSKLLIGPTRLQTGDLIRVGETTLRFECSEPEAAESAAVEQTIYEKTRMAVQMGMMVILVCDIRNFTRIGELLPPDQLSRFLGSWFRQVSEIIAGLGGIVDKFIGDAVMAYWPVDPQQPTAAQENTVTAAVKIVALARAQRVPDNPDFGFRVGVGINQGLVSSGNIGMQSQRDTTIMGDAVTLAFRLESVCAVKQKPIVVSKALADSLADKFQFASLGQVKLKGKATSPEAFHLIID
jgi:class 3 adenylate cyclase